MVFECLELRLERGAVILAALEVGLERSNVVLDTLELCFERGVLLLDNLELGSEVLDGRWLTGGERLISLDALLRRRVTCSAEGAPWPSEYCAWLFRLTERRLR